MRVSFHVGMAAVLILGVLISAGQRADSQETLASASLKFGEAAPDFTLSNIEGKSVRLKDYRGKKRVALVFYPALFRAGG